MKKTEWFRVACFFHNVVWMTAGLLNNQYDKSILFLVQTWFVLMRYFYHHLYVKASVYSSAFLYKLSKIRIRRDCNTLYGNIWGFVTPLLFYYTIETRGWRSSPISRKAPSCWNTWLSHYNPKTKWNARVSQKWLTAISQGWYSQ